MSHRTTMGRSSPLRRSEAGFALAAVVPLILLGLMAWSSTYRHLSPILRLEERDAMLEKQALDSQPALARGIALLRTGRPPEDGYTCRFRFVRDGESVERQVLFSSFGPDLWQVEDLPAAGASSSCPASFEEAGGP